MPQWLADRLISWASILDPETRAQAERLARLPVVSGHVALMADAHLGKGSTVGAVIPTESAILPSAVGVDIGCGMCALRTDLDADHLPDDLSPLLDEFEQRIPAGVGQGHQQEQNFGNWYDATADRGVVPFTAFNPDQARRAATQFGTLGSGNPSRSASTRPTTSGSCCTPAPGASATSSPRRTSPTPRARCRPR